jgi:hypothetical protein
MRDSAHSSQHLWGGKPLPTTPWRTRPRPKALLLRWVNTLVAPPRTASDLHLVFSDGATLCAVLERLRPAAVGLVPFRRAVTRATALRNLEQALALVWQHSPQSRAMPTAAQLLDGAPRELLLRFVSELYSIFVVRPARSRMPLLLPWLQDTLQRYGRRLSHGALQPPHATLGVELRGGGALACVLHAHLPAGQTAELHGGTCKASDSEIEETYVSLGSVFAVLQRERLAPCTAAEFAAAAEAAMAEEEGAPGLLLHTG